MREFTEEAITGYYKPKAHQYLAPKTQDQHAAGHFVHPIVDLGEAERLGNWLIMALMAHRTAVIEAVVVTRAWRGRKFFLPASHPYG